MQVFTLSEILSEKFPIFYQDFSSSIFVNSLYTRPGKLEFIGKPLEIKRKISIIVKTERKFVVRQSKFAENIICEQCAEKMLRAQASADLLSLSSRVIYRLIEAARIHYVETAANEIYVCPSSIEKAVQAAVVVGGLSGGD